MATPLLACLALLAALRLRVPLRPNVVDLSSDEFDGAMSGIGKSDFAFGRKYGRIREVMQASLESKIAELNARQEIYDVLIRYCRGADLCDVQMMRSCYHDDGIDDHGFFNGSGQEFAAIAAANLGSLFSSTHHYIMNHHVDLDGEAATAETHIVCLMRMTRDGVLYDITARCRYLDRFEQRAHDWRISHRQLVSDGTRVDRVEEEFPRLEQGARGARGADDPSVAFFARYARRPVSEHLS